MNDRICMWIQEGRYGFVGALLRERRRQEPEEFERKHLVFEFAPGEKNGR